VSKGANLLVVGRPITTSDNYFATTRLFLKSFEGEH